MTRRAHEHGREHARDRYRGTLLGLAIGDALGTTLEFRPPGTFAPIDDIVGGGPFRLNPGEWTDDTSMALCLAESLVECGGFDPVDQLDRYVRWWRDGHLSSNGRCFDIGNAVRAALACFEHTREPWCGSTAPDTAGNGSLMRLAPVVLVRARSGPGRPPRRRQLAHDARRARGDRRVPLVRDRPAACAGPTREQDQDSERESFGCRGARAR